MSKVIKKEMREHNHQDANNWKGPFYVNSSDPRLMVPKYQPMMGWTLNFGNKYLYLLLITVAGIVVLFGV